MTVQTGSEQQADRLRELIGDPGAVATDLQRHRDSAQVLSSDDPRMIDEYAQKWVAVSDGDVIANESLDALLGELDERGVDRQHVVVRFIERNERLLIL